MMWLIFAFFSAALLGCYDSLKKEALSGNAGDDIQYNC